MTTRVNEAAANIIEAYRQKKVTRKELAELFNRPPNSIYNILRRNGIKIWDKKRNTNTGGIKSKTKRLRKSEEYFSIQDYKRHYFFCYNER